MTNATLTEQYVMSILHQESEGTDFPINFDDIWESAGYTEKRSAVRFLRTCDGLKEGKDYRFSTQKCQTPSGGRSSHLIHLTSVGYEFFLSKSNTEQGHANLRYLIDIKKVYVEHLERQLNATVQPNNELTQLKADNEKLSKENAELVKELLEVLNLIDKVNKAYGDIAKENMSLQCQNAQYFQNECHLEEELKEKTDELLNLHSEYHALYEENKELKAVNEALNSDDYFEQVSPDLRIRRGYWAELMTIYSENCELREKLGMPNLTSRSKKPTA